MVSSWNELSSSETAVGTGSRMTISLNGTP